MWDDDAGMREYRTFMKEWAPNDDIEELIFPDATLRSSSRFCRGAATTSLGRIHQGGNEHSGASTADVPARPDDQRHPIEPDRLEKGEAGAFRWHQMGAVR